MKLPISDRLLACAAFVASGDRVADIGCDHGYLSIHLLTNGIARSCIAADINQQPLLSAVRNAEKYGVHSKMEFHLSDGVRSIPRDFTCMVCAGMGADTMISILEAAPWLQSSQYRFVLQCQSKTPMLRRYLSDHGWRITEESVLRDGKFLYTVMEVYYEPEYPRLTEAECYFPPALLENPSKDIPAYYKWVVEGVRIAAAHNPEKQPVLAALEALAETEELHWLEK
ncbi:MAG: SAM-dependent methyltransferase [Oscillospiraceae bacterium]|nr:SAM-dependent methyltransferase [Oscillospiraceae bacterium]